VFLPLRALRETIRNNTVDARADLDTAYALGDDDQVSLLRVLVEGPGELLLYHPARDHYGVLFGDLGAVAHVAVVVPGVGRDLNLVFDWIPWAENLADATTDSAVVLWKGYDDPPDLAEAALDIVVDDRRADSGAARLSAFVSGLPVHPDQTVTVIAHSFGSLVAGEALANHGLACQDVVVLGSPGIGVESLEELHLRAGHFFAEKAPGDLVAGLGAIGADPASLSFGATRLATNAAGAPQVEAHSNYFTRGSAALGNMANVVMGRYDRLETHRSTVAGAVGNLVATLIKAPFLPVTLLSHSYEGPGFRLVRILDRGVHLTATESGGLVRDGINVLVTVGDRALAAVRG
jgi:pimeloyl-ACP methyl ester carboxylesterase